MLRRRRMNFNLKVFKVISVFSIMLAAMFTFTFTARANNDDVKPDTIEIVGSQEVSVKCKEEFELKVNIGPDDADEDYLRWKIVSGSSNVKFDDEDLNDDEIELKAVKAGTAKVRCKIKGTDKQVIFNITVTKASIKTIKAVESTKTVEIGDDFELEVKKYSGLKNRCLKWRIQDPKIVKFEDDDDDNYDDRTGDDAEFEAKKIGTTQVYCKNTKTKQIVTFTVTVVNDIDDDSDEDDDDDYNDNDEDDEDEN